MGRKTHTEADETPEVAETPEPAQEPESETARLERLRREDSAGEGRSES